MTQTPSAYNAIAPSGRFIEFVCSQDIYNGTLLDPTNDRVQYVIETPAKLLGDGVTNVNLADGTNVGSIDWRGSLDTSKRTVTLHGKTVDSSQFLQKVSGGMFKGKRTMWEDDWGICSIGQKARWCHNAQDEVIANYVRGKKHIIRDNKSARLTIDNNYLPLLDHVLLSVMLMEDDVGETSPTSTGTLLVDGAGSGVQQ
ncbi:hypothetical protein FRB94_005977 [Tulasnella sp. JGI-2019a]|nr:hypothetical protein FRB93_013495 [Tulasnella sp. JGI-2019a]KAG8999724.1 hypothetical protein FRB94_005977 [Tulasnella sp. JGI-2019a]